VWNQDNREKVLKDERLHEEEVKRKVDVENRLIQEKTYEVLNNVMSRPTEERNDEDGGGGDNIQPFRLFGDIEQQLLAKKSTENSEYVAEKMKSEQLKRKREGVEPWLLGDGSHEVKKNKPWYEVVKKEHPFDQSSSRPIVTDESLSQLQATGNPATARDMKRKDRSDPMQPFLRPKMDSLIVEKVKEELTRQCMENVIDLDVKVIRSCAHDDIVVKQEDHDHESRHHRHHKHRKEHKSHKGSKSKDKSDPSAVDSRDGLWDALRKERLEREAVERKRSAVLLAKRDIYGQAAVAGGYDRYGCSESYGYGQQYHPHLAKNYQH